MFNCFPILRYQVVLHECIGRGSLVSMLSSALISTQYKCIFDLVIAFNALEDSCNVTKIISYCTIEEYKNCYK